AAAEQPRLAEAIDVEDQDLVGGNLPAHLLQVVVFPAPDLPLARAVYRLELRGVRGRQAQGHSRAVFDADAVLRVDRLGAREKLLKSNARKTDPPKVKPTLVRPLFLLLF